MRVARPVAGRPYRRKVADLATAIHAPEGRDEAFELVRSLIDRVVLAPEDDQLRVDLPGDLAGILTLCEEGSRGKRPAASVEAGGANQDGCGGTQPP